MSFEEDLKKIEGGIDIEIHGIVLDRYRVAIAKVMDSARVYMIDTEKKELDLNINNMPVKMKQDGEIYDTEGEKIGFSRLPEVIRKHYMDMQGMTGISVPDTNRAMRIGLEELMKGIEGLLSHSP